MTARFTYYGTNTVDFDIRYDSLNIQWIQEREENKTAKGKIETILFYSVMRIDLTAILTQEQYRQMVGFYSYARQGYSFSFAVNTNLATDTTLDDSAAAGQKVIPLTDTTGFSTGDYCLIRAEDNDNEFEIVKIASIDTGVSITAVDNLIYSYNSSDIFRHWQYWPSVRMVETNFNPMELDKTTKYTYDFTLEETDMPIARSVNPFDFGSPSTLTINDGVIIAPRPGYYLVATEGSSASDDLDQIQGLSNGQIILLGPANSSETVVVKAGSYLKTLAGTDFSLDDAYDIFEGMCVGSNIIKERGRSNNA